MRRADARKGIPMEPVPPGFTDIPRVLGPVLRTIPVREDGRGRRGGSRDIVDPLDARYPDTPALFIRPRGRAP